MTDGVTVTLTRQRAWQLYVLTAVPGEDWTASITPYRSEHIARHMADLLIDRMVYTHVKIVALQCSDGPCPDRGGNAQWEILKTTYDVRPRT